MTDATFDCLTHCNRFCFCIKINKILTWELKRNVAVLPGSHFILNFVNLFHEIKGQIKYSSSFYFLSFQFLGMFFFFHLNNMEPSKLSEKNMTHASAAVSFTQLFRKKIPHQSHQHGHKTAIYGLCQWVIQILCNSYHSRPVGKPSDWWGHSGL